MQLSKKHGGYKLEEVSLKDLHTIIDALEYHLEGCHEAVGDVLDDGSAEREIEDIIEILRALATSGVSEVANYSTLSTPEIRQCE